MRGYVQKSKAVVEALTTIQDRNPEADIASVAAALLRCPRRRVGLWMDGVARPSSQNVAMLLDLIEPMERAAEIVYQGYPATTARSVIQFAERVGLELGTVADFYKVSVHTLRKWRDEEVTARTRMPSDDQVLAFLTSLQSQILSEASINETLSMDDLVRLHTEALVAEIRAHPDFVPALHGHVFLLVDELRAWAVGLTEPATNVDLHESLEGFKAVYGAIGKNFPFAKPAVDDWLTKRDVAKIVAGAIALWAATGIPHP